VPREAYAASSAKAELERRDRHQEGIGDPRQLRRSGPEILLEQVVEDGRDGKPDLRDGHRHRGGGNEPACFGIGQVERGRRQSAAFVRNDNEDQPEPRRGSTVFAS
jgi:hypothetical protein